MRASKLISIAALVFMASMLGCSDDDEGDADGGVTDTGTADSGVPDTGTGDSGATDTGTADPCTGDQCDDPAEPNQALCEATVERCNTETDRTDCDELGAIICPIEFEPPTGGADAGPDAGPDAGAPLCTTPAEEACVGGLCEIPSSNALCTRDYEACVNAGGTCEDCLIWVDFWCLG